VLLAVGCRFADETACSYRRGSAFGIPETKLIHMDIDPHEIGKNYPTEVGIVTDAKAGLAALARALEERGARDWEHSDYCAEIARRRAEWEQFLATHRDDAREPVMISTMLRRLRAVLPRDAFVVHSSGNTQAQIIQEFPFYDPGTSITTGGFSTMGFTLPASIGVKLAQPQRTVVGVTGDGDFLMHIQELSTAVRYGVPVVWVVANNEGWISIRDLQTAAFGGDHVYATDFERAGQAWSPNLADVARDFGCWSCRISRADEIGNAVEEALASDRPAVVEVMVCRDWPHTGSPAVGWWDVPVPAHMAGREAYDEALAEQDV
jgi:acetolactate synthase-1/2/3 large subunit